MYKSVPVMLVALAIVGCKETPAPATVAGASKRVQEQLGLAEFEVPTDWTALPSKEDYSVQYYPENADVVLRVRALAFDAQDRAKETRLDDLLDKLTSGTTAVKGTTKAGDPWRKTTKTDKEGRATYWYVAKAHRSSLVVVVFTYSDTLPTTDPRSEPAQTAAAAAVDSTVFLKKD